MLELDQVHTGFAGETLVDPFALRIVLRFGGLE